MLISKLKHTKLALYVSTTLTCVSQFRKRGSEPPSRHCFQHILCWKRLEALPVRRLQVLLRVVPSMREEGVQTVDPKVSQSVRVNNTSRMDTVKRPANFSLFFSIRLITCQVREARFHAVQTRSKRQ